MRQGFTHSQELGLHEGLMSSRGLSQCSPRMGQAIPEGAEVGTVCLKESLSPRRAPGHASKRPASQMCVLIETQLLTVTAGGEGGRLHPLGRAAPGTALALRPPMDASWSLTDPTLLLGWRSVERRRAGKATLSDTVVNLQAVEAVGHERGRRPTWGRWGCVKA